MGLGTPPLPQRLMKNSEPPCQWKKKIVNANGTKRVLMLSEQNEYHKPPPLPLLDPPPKKKGGEKVKPKVKPKYN